MSVTLDHMRLFILTCTQAFAGKRGRSGVLGYLRGETTPSTVELGRENGLQDLYGALKGMDSEEVHSVLSTLLSSHMLEIRKVEARGTEMPLLFITDRGQDEIKRLGATGITATRSSAGSPEKMLGVLMRIAHLITTLGNGDSELTVDMQQYVQLIGKALGLRPDIHMANAPGRRQFAEILLNGLQRSVFAHLPELEAQCLRLACGINARNQLTEEEMKKMYGEIDVSSQARSAIARLAAKSWPHKSPLLSVMGFLAIMKSE